MKRFIAPLTLILLIGCSSILPDYSRQYYALNQIDVALLESANIAVQDCMKREASHPCRKAIPPLQDVVKVNKKTFASTDAIFAKGDTSYYVIALKTAENAIESLKGAISIVNP